MKPDVIYFLTDSGEPELNSAQLERIREVNRGRTRIHCIEFGVLADLAPENFLKKLAAGNGGRHLYRDITQFEQQAPQ
jgi:hypothetical protein